MSRPPEKDAWYNMIARCCNPKSQRYDRYGLRGISVCKRWVESFENFLADVGERPTNKHSLDRIDNDGNYEPGNVRWALREQQENNKSTNRVLEYLGESMTISQWSRRQGIPIRTLMHRLDVGWTIEAALTTPVQNRKWVYSSGRRLNEAERQSIRLEHASGKTISSISKDHKVSITTVRTVVYGRPYVPSGEKTKCKSP